MRTGATFYRSFLTLLAFFAMLLSGCGGGSTSKPTPLMRDFSQIEDLIKTKKISELIIPLPDGYTPLPDRYIFLGDYSLGTFVTLVPVEEDPQNANPDNLHVRAVLEILLNKPQDSTGVNSGKYLLSYRQVSTGNFIVYLVDPQTLEPVYRAFEVFAEPMDTAPINTVTGDGGGVYTIIIDFISNTNSNYKASVSFPAEGYYITASFDLGNLNTPNQRIVGPDGTVIDIILFIKYFMEQDSQLFDLQNLNLDNISVLITPDTIVALAPTADGAFGYMKVGYENTNKAVAVRMVTENGILRIFDSLGNELLTADVGHDVQTYGGTKRIGIAYDPFSENKVEVHCECENARVAPGECVKPQIPDPFPYPFPIDGLLQ
ncbi:MAG: hypothetical protein GXO18_03915 [Aquificae bacterium]|nr:hypothetical protein [Aquificota bacterium]